MATIMTNTQITDIILNIFSPKGFAGFLEIMGVVIMVLYIIYAFVLTRQVKLMTRSFTTPIAPMLSFIATIHLFAAIGLTFLAVITL